MSAVTYELEDGFPVIVREMLPVTRAADLFLGDLIRRGYSQRTIDSYRRLIDKLAERLPLDTDIGSAKRRASPRTPRMTCAATSTR